MGILLILFSSKVRLLDVIFSFLTHTVEVIRQVIIEHGGSCHLDTIAEYVKMVRVQFIHSGFSLTLSAMAQSPAKRRHNIQFYGM